MVWFHSENRERLLSGQENISQTLERLAPCTAVVCYNDEVAVKLEKALLSQGLRVPQDKAIISFDNSQCRMQAVEKVFRIGQIYGLGQTASYVDLMNCVG